MTFESKPRYIDWDYDDMLAVEYERHGECNQCGECCQSLITFKGKREGAKGPSEIGVWSEVDRDEERIFFRSISIELDKNTCPRYKNETCTCYNERAAICEVWPYTPRDSSKMPMCGYWFDEINSWKIE